MIKLWNNILRLYRRWFTNIDSKFRVVVLDQSYHEKLSLNISRGQFWNTIISIFLLGAIAASALILFTPIRQYVPGFTKEEFSESVYQNRIILDSLSKDIESQGLMLSMFQMAMSGEIPVEDAEILKDSAKTYSNVKYVRSKADSLLRQEFESAAAVANLKEMSNSERHSFSDNILFFNPVQGDCIKDFDSRVYPGIDISTSTNEAVKASLPGYVIFASWMPDQSYVIIIQHEDNLLSYYGGNSALLKTVGSYVELGEAIAMAGNRLHFQLWYNGLAVNPRNYLNI